MATKPVEIEILMRDRLSAGLDKAGRKVDDLKTKAGGASAEMERLERLSESVRSTVSKIAGAFAVKELVSNIVRVRGEFQQLEASFRTMLGSEEKAGALMQQLIRTAATTPFDLQSVASGARQLLAYGENVENVNDDLIRLGNIAAGLNQPLSDLIYLYGTTMTQGRLYTADYNQFVGRGIPLGRELASVLGVAESKVREMVEAGKVGFPEVRQALQNLTNEGGMFYNLMEEQSRTITGRISNIQDSIGMMMNEIGQQSEGIIGGSLDAVAYLVDHYEQMGRVLLGLVGTYGAYKTAVMAVTAMQALQTAGVGALTVAETLHYGWLVIVEKAQKLLNATMLANPYVLVATLVAGVVAAMVSMKTETERLKEAEEAYQAAKRKTIEAEEEHRRRLEELCGVAGDENLATDTRREALNKLEQKYPDIFAKYDTELDKLKNIRKIKEEIAGLEAGRSITRVRNELDSVDARIAELERKKATEQYVTDYTQTSAYTAKVGGLSSREEAELRNLKEKRKVLSEQVRKERANAYFEDLTGISNATLERQIRQRETLLSRMTAQQKKYGNITYGAEALRGTFSRDELQYQLNKLNAEKNRRNLKRGSSADWGTQARKEYEEALRAYNDFLADTSNSLTQEEYEKKAKELQDALSLAKKEYDRYKPDENKAADKAGKEAERRIHAEEKLGDFLISLEQENQRAWLALQDEGTEKKLAQIDADYEKRKAEIAKKARELASANREAGVAEVNASGLTKPQQDEIDRANGLNEDTRRKRISDVEEEEASAMDIHLARFGAYQERKLAIIREYQRKLAEASTEGERLSLQKEMEEALSSLDLEKLKGSINWELVFGDLSHVSKEELEKVKAQLESFRDSPEYKKMNIDQKRTVDKALSGIQSALIDKGGLLGGLPDQLDALRKAQDELTRAQEAYDAALKTGTEAEKEAALSKRNSAQNKVATAERNVSTASEIAVRSITTLGQAIAELGSASEMSLSDMGNMAEQVASLFGEMGSKVGGIIGAALSLIGTIQEQGLGNFLKNMGKMGNDLARETSEFFTFGLVDFGGESDESLEEDIETLSATNEALTGAIEALTEEIKDASGQEASDLYKEQKAGLDAAERNTQEMMRRSLNAYSDGFLGMGGTKSSRTHVDKAMSSAEWERISGIAGRSISNASDFFSMSSEEMLAVYKSAPDLYAKIKAAADDGYRNASQYMDEYIAFAEQREELERSYYESLTQVSFESVYDSFLDTLMDMEASWEDLSDDLSEYLMRALLKTKLDERLRPEMESWYKAFGDAMSDGILSDVEREELSGRWKEIVDEGLKLRDAASSATGYTGEGGGRTQTGKGGSFNAMSQEQGTKLEGLFTSGQMHWASMDERLQDVSEQMGMAVGHLRRIEENTGNSAKHLGEIKEDIKRIIRDGLKMK